MGSFSSEKRGLQPRVVAWCPDPELETTGLRTGVDRKPPAHGAAIR
jgi:hypothetical protein